MPQASKCKPGRNKVSCASYKSENRHGKSHMRRIKRHLLRYGRDNVATEAYVRYAGTVGSSVLASAKEFVKTV